MSLLEIATETLNNFDPAKDSVDTFEELPDGNYNALLEEVKAKENDKGTEWVSFVYSVVGDEYANRKIFVNYFFTEKMTARSVKMLTKLAYDFGFELPVEAFETLEGLAQTLNDTFAGNTMAIEKTTSNSGFVNYKVTPSDLPF